MLDLLVLLLLLSSRSEKEKQYLHPVMVSAPWLRKQWKGETCFHLLMPAHLTELEAAGHHVSVLC